MNQQTSEKLFAAPMTGTKMHRISQREAHNPFGKALCGARARANGFTILTADKAHAWVDGKTGYEWCSKCCAGEVKW